VTTALTSRRSAFEQLVGGILHRKQLWFHGAINREESELRMRRQGVRDGLFLVRERTQASLFCCCCCCCCCCLLPLDKKSWGDCRL